MELLLVVVVLLVLGLSGLIFWRRRQTPAPSPATPADPEIITMESEERAEGVVAYLPAPPAARRRQKLVRRAALLLGLALLLGVGMVGYELWSARAPWRFVVVVAPFDDGADGQSGRNVAAELAQLIDGLADNGLTVAVAPTIPGDPAAALALAASEQADLLIWGTVEPGAMLDSPGLRPRIVYTPNGTDAPNGWDGYLGRFSMPHHYDLADTPINGRAVLTPLVIALYDYTRGQPDLAFNRLGQLLQDYPELNPTLLRALRGNVLWARRFYPEAADEYRLALITAESEPARLASNLGAILFDAGDPATLTALAEAVRLLAGGDLGELRVNLGLLALREQRPADAVVDFEQASNLLAPSSPLLLNLVRAYRDSGRLDDATVSLNAAEQQLYTDAELVADAYRAGFNQRIQANLDEEQALLELARLIAAQGLLTWELEVIPPQPPAQLNPIRDRLIQAGETARNAVGFWRRRAAAESAASSGTGIAATGQAERADLHSDRKRYYTALVEAELERSTRGEPAGIFSSLLRGGSSGSPSLETLNDLARRDPSNLQIRAAIGRSQLILGQVDAADQSYDQVINLAPQAPEGYFGRGRVAEERGDSLRASELFNVAVDRNNAFFPARFGLARLAEQRGDWPAAIEQYRALAQLRPGSPSTVALAHALRLSGSSGWVEAEELLRALAPTRVDAAIELARLYNDAGQPDPAAGAYRNALTLEPRNSTAAFELGETLARLGDYGAAERSFQDALRFDPQHIDARLALADLYLGPLNHPARADEAYRDALDQGLNDPERLAQIGAAAMANANTTQAIKAYKMALALQPDNAHLHLSLGQALYAANKLNDAQKSLTRALELSASQDDLAQSLHTAALVGQGDVARRQGNAIAANEAYRQALQINPNLIPAQLGLGLVAVGEGTWGVAHGYFEQAAALPEGATNAEAQFWFAESLLRRNELRAASEHYNQALALRPRFPEAYLGLAQAQHAQGDPNSALATVNQGLEQRPAYAEALLFKGKLLQQLGRPGEALIAYDRSIAADSSFAETHYRRGVLRIERDQIDGAISDLRQAIKLNSNFPEAYYWLGRAYHAQGRLEPALEAFERAISYNPAYAEAHFYSGLVAEDLGHTEDAVRAYQTVIQIDEASELAARARAQLSRLT